MLVSLYEKVDKDSGNSKGRIMASFANPENIVYEVIQEFPDAIPDQLKGISLCKTHNYYVDMKNMELIMADKQFAEVKRFSFPAHVKEAKKWPSKVWVSPCEQYVFIDMGNQYDPDDFAGTYDAAKSVSYLLKIYTMELVQEFDYECVSDFTMINEDKKFIISTWQGTYVGEV